MHDRDPARPVLEIFTHHIAMALAPNYYNMINALRDTLHSLTFTPDQSSVLNGIPFPENSFGSSSAFAVFLGRIKIWRSELLMLS